MPFSTKFRPIDYPIAGGSYESRSKPLSQQRTLNMYPEVTEGGRVDIALRSWPGLKLVTTGGASEADRGIYRQLFKGKAYQVAGTTLYEIDSSLAKTNIGSIPGTGRVFFEDNGVVLVILADGVAYSYDGTTLTTLSYSFTPKTLAYLNNQFIFGDTDGVVRIATPGTTDVDSSNQFSPDSNPDQLVRVYAYDQFLFNLNTNSIEPWENTGQGIPPFSRMDGVIIERVGLVGVNAVTDTPKAVYFLGTNNEPYEMVNFQINKIGQPAVVGAFQGYGDNASCICNYVSFENQNFVLFSFPTQNATWVYSEDTKLWFELDHNVNGSRYLGSSFQHLFSKNIAGDYSNGNLYELDFDTFQDNGITKVRERVLRPLSGEQFSNPRQRFQLKEIRFSMETGVGNADSVNPKVIVSLSRDGVTFGQETWHELGREGERQQDIFMSSNMNVTDLVAKVRFTEDNSFSLYSANAFIREAGK